MAAYGWFFYALGTAMLWGFCYSAADKVLKDGVHPAIFMLANGLAYIIMIVPYFWIATNMLGGLKSQMNLLWANKTTLFLLIGVTAAYTLGNYLILTSMSLKNATMTNLIEISYPLFTILFAWILFREFHLGIGTMIGAAFIFAGVGIILVKG